ncbi:MAG: hypothetical protein U1F43_24025 [Myxococcota bacterium]
MRRSSPCKSPMPGPSASTLRWRGLASIVLATLSIAACADPCKDLEKKVCEDPKYLKAHKKHCDLMQDQDRRENLPKDACKGILDFLTKR